jgi:mRNA-degrading endonuclease RelE of RelBE toxin-antitoxin system
VYSLELDPRAIANIQRLDVKIQEQIRAKMNQFRESFEQRRHKALKGKHKGRFSVIYTLKIFVHEIGHRSKIY